MKKWYRAFTLAFAFVTCARAAAADSVTLFRVFLADGTTVVSYGEYARVGDRVVFSMPIGLASAKAGPSSPALHLVNLPATVVDWSATSRYAESARYAHYLATSAETDYAALTAGVAAVLNSVMVAKDPQSRLDLAIQARRRLSSWPREHYGYRADDVREVVGMLDDVIPDLRAAAGGTSFSLDLVGGMSAAVYPPKPPPLFRDPTPAETIAQALAVARIADVSADRISLLRAVIVAVDNPRNAVEKEWAKRMRRSAESELESELRTVKNYDELAISVLRRADRAALEADVHGVELAMEAAEEGDQKLGAKRKDLIDPVFSQIRLQLNAARKLRLARDWWHERVGAFRVYQNSVGPIVATLLSARETLERIKNLNGLQPDVLSKTAFKLDVGIKRLNAMNVPGELSAAHALLLSATNLAASAVKSRRDAVTAADMKSAWDASAAAAGSMMLLKKAGEEMEATVKFPQLR